MNKELYFTGTKTKTVEFSQPQKTILIGVKVNLIPIAAELLTKRKDVIFQDRAARVLELSPQAKNIIITPAPKLITVPETENVKYIFIGKQSNEIEIGPKPKNLHIGKDARRIEMSERFEVIYIYLVDDFGNILTDDSGNLLTEN